MKTVDSNEMRVLNSSTIMRLIWSNHGVSRADLSRITGMSRSSVSEIVAELMQNELVSEVGTGESKGGRRPRMLKFNDDAHAILAVSLGQYRSQLALLNLRGQIRHALTLDYGLMNEAALVMDRLLSDLRQLLTHEHIADEDLIGIGVALPCPVHPDSKQPISNVLFPHWAGVDLIARLRQHFDSPIFVENDANLGALAEHWWGVKRDNHLIYIAVSEGYGAGIVINGQIFRGRHGMAGEISHMIVDASGGQWHRGIQGNLSSYIGEAALLTRYEELLKVYPSATAEISLAGIVKALQQEERAALALLDHLARYFAMAIANLVHLLDIDTIVIGGAITEFGDKLFQRIRMKIREFSLWPDINRITIDSASMGRYQVSIGAGTLVLESYLSGELGRQKSFNALVSPMAH